MTSTTATQLASIKRSFRPYMNGVTAQSMRDKGIHYKVNWGVALTDVQKIARDYAPDSRLAHALWHEDVRECKIMALLLMPTEAVDEPTADSMVAQMPNTEMAELGSFLLLQHIPDAPRRAMKWISGSEALTQLCGYHVLARSIRRGTVLTPNDRHLLFAQASACLQKERSTHLACRKAAALCLSLIEEQEPHTSEKNMIMLENGK